MKFSLHSLKPKRIDTFITEKFLQMFVAAFFVCLFIFMMQFTWRYIDDLVGKGLTLDVLAQFFWYMAITLVPQAFPLAFLLASLITFGNMGENLELLSMKAAGIPLLRVMRPLIFFCLLSTGVSFYFQNTFSPSAQRSLRQLLISMRESQPAVEIPEGIFYNGIPNVNIYVEKKDAKTGKLYNVIIYKTDQGFDKAQIVLADSGHMSMTADKLHLQLELWNGHQFQSMQQGQASSRINANEPYDHEVFMQKYLLIDFDANFNLSESEVLRNMPSAKSMAQIELDADSMSARLDSAALSYVNVVKSRQMARRAELSREDSVRLQKIFKAKPLNIDSVFAKAKDLQRAKNTADMAVRQMSYDLNWKNEINEGEEVNIRRHWIEWHTRFSLSLSCLLFFFIGAPLGAIIRKGGLGMPAVVSVGIFIIYYIINISGMKMARSGNIAMELGMWISTAVLLPAGVYLTYMSNRDSQVFNKDAYMAIIRKVLGLRVKRHLMLKEVVIDDPDYRHDLLEVRELRQLLLRMKANPLMGINYLRFRKSKDMEELTERLECLIEELGNTRDIYILQALNSMPVISKRHFFRDKRQLLKQFDVLEKLLKKNHLTEEELEEIDGQMPETDGAMPETDGAMLETDGAMPEADGAMPDETSVFVSGNNGETAKEMPEFDEANAAIPDASTAPSENAFEESAEWTEAMPEDDAELPEDSIVDSVDVTGELPEDSIVDSEEATGELPEDSIVDSEEDREETR